MLGDALFQLGQAKGHGISQRIGQIGDQPVPGRLRRTGARLADLHMDDVTARRLGLTRGLHHIHHDERINISPV